MSTRPSPRARRRFPAASRIIPRPVKLANLINSGALPFAVEVKSYGTIEPTMGMKALDVMVWAGLIAFILISIYLLIYYRLPGFVCHPLPFWVRWPAPWPAFPATSASSTASP